MAKLVWQQGSSNPDNSSNFATMQQWWEGLHGKEIQFAQRLLPPSGEAMELDWTHQRFDEKFVILEPQVRGITLYWQRPDLAEERSLFPRKLEFDSLSEKLYIYPQSQQQVAVRIGFPPEITQTLELDNPQIAGTTSGDRAILLFQDREQQVEVKIILDATKIERLKQILG